VSNDPDQIREEIEITRTTLSTDVNTLADTVRPGNVARRQVDRVRDAASGAKDRVMGSVPGLGSSSGSGSGLGDTASSAADSVKGTASSVGSSIGDAASSSQQALREAPDTIKAKAQGNPLAAGLIAFGAGWLASSLIPATKAETAAGAKLKENASVVTGPVTDVAKEVGSNLQGPAQEAVDAVKSTATDAADTVKAEGTSAAQDVKDQSVEAKETVQNSRS